MVRKKYTTRDMIDIIILAICLFIGGNLFTVTFFIPNNIIGKTLTGVAYVFFLIGLIVIIHCISSRKKR
jgi:predicted tellurium resistance membrane protein TerC